VKLNLILPAGLALLLAAGAAPAQDMEEDYFFSTAWRNFFSPAGALRPALRVLQEYDDNIGLTPAAEREGSWKTLLIPTIGLDLPGEQTSLLIEYTPVFCFYYRRGDELDIDHDAAVKFSHYFTPRYWIHINDLFLRKEMPQDIRRPVIPQEREADYNFNLLELAFGNQLTRRLSWGLAYDLERYDYDRPAVKRLFDRTNNAGEATFRCEIDPRLRLSGSYILRFSDYDQAQSDFYYHILRVGCSYLPYPLLTARAWVGYQSSHYAAGQTLNGPYAEVGLVFTPLPEMGIEVSYWHKIQDTYEIARRGGWENGIKGNFRWRALSKTELVLDYLGIFSHYPSALMTATGEESANENFWRLEASAKQDLAADVSVRAGYRHTGDNSDFPGAAYRRNQSYLEIRVVF